jgi:hypothetical protein
MTPDEKPHFFDKPGNLKKFLRGFYIICAILLAVDFVHHRHVVHDWENMWGFYAVYGFVACVLLVEIAKLMRAVLMRAPDYYEKD